MAAESDPSILELENTDPIVSGNEARLDISGAGNIKYLLTVRLLADDAAAAAFYEELVSKVSGCPSAEVAGGGDPWNAAFTAPVDHGGFVTWTRTATNATAKFGMVSANRLILLVRTTEDVDDPTFEADLEAMRLQLLAP